MTKELKIVFFGDSICVGQGVAIHNGWVSRISKEVESLGNALGAAFVVVNSSVNGDTTRGALERMPYEVQTLGAVIMIVQFGLNDCNYWLTDKGLPRVSAEAFAANLKEITQRGLNFGTQHIFVHTNHPTLRNKERMTHSDITFQESNLAYNILIRETVSQLPENVTLIDIEAEFENRFSSGKYSLEQLLLPDCLHLSKVGHNVYFDIIKIRLLQKIRDIASLTSEIPSCSLSS